MRDNTGKMSMSDLRSMAGYTSSKYWDNSLAWANIAGETVWGRFLCHVGKVACLRRGRTITSE